MCIIFTFSHLIAFIITADNNDVNSTKIKSHDSPASCGSGGTSQDKQWSVSLLLLVVRLLPLFMKIAVSIMSVAGAVMSVAGAVAGGLSSKAVEVARLFMHFTKVAVSSVMSVAVAIVGWWSSKVVEGAEEEKDVFFFVQLPDGILQLKFNPDMQIGDVKAAVGSILDVPPNSIVFKPFRNRSFLRSRVDNATLKEYDIHPLDKLSLEEEGLPGGGRKEKGKKKGKGAKEKNGKNFLCNSSLICIRS